MVRLQKYKLYEYMVALCVFINGLGFVIPIAGINISEERRVGKEC